MYINKTGERDKHSCCLREERGEGERQKKEEEGIITACVPAHAPTLIVKKSESWENSPQYADERSFCHSHGVGPLIRPCLCAGGS